MKSYGETNPGRKRRRNEDAFVCEPPLFAVADGMGGAQAGEVASSLAAATLSGALDNHHRLDTADAEQVVLGLIQEANRLVHERATHDAAASGMGTTMTVALVGSDDTVAIGHVGDSRAYLLRDGASSSSPTTTRSWPSSCGAASCRPQRRRCIRSGP